MGTTFKKLNSDHYTNGMHKQDTKLSSDHFMEKKKKGSELKLIWIILSYNVYLRPIIIIIFLCIALPKR